MNIVNQTILFGFKTAGTSAAAGKLNSLKLGHLALAAAAVAGAKAIGDAVEQAQKFGVTLRANRTDMTAFNGATAGLIDTSTAVAKAVEFQNAKMELQLYD